MGLGQWPVEYELAVCVIWPCVIIWIICSTKKSIVIYVSAVCNPQTYICCFDVEDQHSATFMCSDHTLTDGLVFISFPYNLYASDGQTTSKCGKSCLSNTAVQYCSVLLSLQIRTSHWPIKHCFCSPCLCPEGPDQACKWMGLCWEAVESRR